MVGKVHCQEGGMAGQGQAGPECTHIGIRSTPEATWFIPLDHLMNL